MAQLWLASCKYKNDFLSTSCHNSLPFFIVSLQITEDQFVQVAIDFAEGDFDAPSFFPEEELSEEQLADFKQANIFRKVSKHQQSHTVFMWILSLPTLGV